MPFEAQIIPVAVACGIALIPPAIWTIYSLRKKPDVPEADSQLLTSKPEHNSRGAKPEEHGYDMQEIAGGIGEPNTRWWLMKRKTRRGVKLFLPQQIEKFGCTP
ncbi:hypothetical protein HY357_03930 [Candidatus Roizmanbacteria bacterium]|nr:hypothetical protein [Candidatus Roizmanbacteria bacterium]